MRDYSEMDTTTEKGRSDAWWLTAVVACFIVAVVFFEVGLQIGISHGRHLERQRQEAQMQSSAQVLALYGWK